MARRPFQGAAPQTDKGPRVNRMIDVNQVRLINHNGEMVGVVSRSDALRMAEETGLDLVEVSPNAEPPVCKIIDYGKFKYEAQKKANIARKKQKTVEIKEIKMRPNIDTHDYETKMRAARRFLDEGDKVKVTVRFRGREMMHSERGMTVLERIQTDLGEVARIEQTPRMEGRMMTMIVAPR